MQLNEKTKKILGVTSKVLTWIVLAFTIFIMVFTIVTVSTIDKNDKSLFGRKFYIVQTDSMSKSDKNKDLDVHFKAGDIISFISTNSESYGETITHMIRKVETTSDGKTIGYVTYGTNTGVDDEALVEPNYVLGKYSGKLPGLGKFFSFVKSTSGYIVCILVPFLLLILYNGVNVIRLFRRYKKEQTAAMEAEKAQIAEDKRQAEEMLKELQALKKQLGIKADNPPDNGEETN